jgi:hypothetical protein
MTGDTSPARNVSKDNPCWRCGLVVFFAASPSCSPPLRCLFWSKLVPLAQKVLPLLFALFGGQSRPLHVPVRAAKHGPKSLCFPDALPTFDPKLSSTLPRRGENEFTNPLPRDASTLNPCSSRIGRLPAEHDCSLLALVAYYPQGGTHFVRFAKLFPTGMGRNADSLT